MRFLHLVVRTNGGVAPWQEASEREVTAAVGAVGELVTDPKLTRFSFPADEQAEGEVRRRQERLDGEIVISACLVCPRRAPDHRTGRQRDGLGFHGRDGPE